ncbi:MAG: YgaP family membrane protein [Candidatus Hodarchaeales archaeon]
MEKNVGITDRNIRIVLGIISLIVALLPFINSSFTFLISDVVQLVVFGLVAIIMFFTSYTRFCILYKPFNIKTNK